MLSLCYRAPGAKERLLLAVCYAILALGCASIAVVLWPVAVAYHEAHWALLLASSAALTVVMHVSLARFLSLTTSKDTFDLHFKLPRLRVFLREKRTKGEQQGVPVPHILGAFTAEMLALTSFVAGQVLPCLLGAAAFITIIGRGIHLTFPESQILDWEWSTIRVPKATALQRRNRWAIRKRATPPPSSSAP